MKCPGCGVLHGEEQKFCDYCGARLTRRSLKGLFAVFGIMVTLFLGSYLFTTGVLSIHEKSFNDKTQRPLTAASVHAVKNSLRPMRSAGAAPVMARPTAKIEGSFAVAQADDQSPADKSATPGTAAPDSHVAEQAESRFNLMRDPLNAEK